MSHVLIEDTARNNLASWGADAIRDQRAAGVVLNPFCSPFVSNRYKPSAQRQAEQISAAGGEVWFDPMTHALQMPGVGDFRYYDQWDLWDESSRGSMTTRAQRRDHLLRVFEHQRRLGASPMAPTLLVRAPADQDVVSAVALLEDALDLEPSTGGAIAGTPDFWSSGQPLDTLVGTLAQLQPSTWFISVVRPTEDLPPLTSSEEVAGICRTVRSLSVDVPVHLSFSDLVGLPGVVAGARTVGTGWDPRQRMCHNGSYVERASGGTGGAWFQRPTVQRLFAYVPRGELERVFAQDTGFASSIFEGALHPDGPREAFDHHLEVLQWVHDQLRDLSDRERFDLLDALYSEALGHWSEFARLSGALDRSGDWIAPLQAGLRLFARDEGWLPDH